MRSGDNAECRKLRLARKRIVQRAENAEFGKFRV